MALSPADLLARVPFGEGLSRPALSLLCRGAAVRRYRARQILFRAGEAPEGIHVVLDGRVRVVREAHGRRQVIHAEERGGTLGEIPMFAGGLYPATAVAATHTRCLLLPRHAISAAMAAHPEVAFRLLYRLATRVRELVARLDAVRFVPVATRLARHLALRMERVDDAWSVSLVDSQEELAEEIGTVREVLVRELRALRLQGVIVPAGRRRYEVRDPIGLQRIALG